MYGHWAMDSREMLFPKVKLSKEVHIKMGRKMELSRFTPNETFLIKRLDEACPSFTSCLFYLPFDYNVMLGKVLYFASA